MKTFRVIAAFLVVALALPGPATRPVAAAPVGKPVVADRIVQAQIDCYAIGQQVAARNGGTLARATPQQQGGQTVCVIVVLMPAKDGQRPRRAEFVVPPG